MKRIKAEGWALKRKRLNGEWEFCRPFYITRQEARDRFDSLPSLQKPFYAIIRVRVTEVTEKHKAKLGIAIAKRISNKRLAV